MLLQDTLIAGIPLIGLSLGLLLILLMSMGGLSFAFMKAIQGGGSTRRVRELEALEAQAFQDLQHGFKRMEERLDSLEMLFIGPARNRGYDREFD